MNVNIFAEHVAIIYDNLAILFSFNIRYTIPIYNLQNVTPVVYKVTIIM
jgi:hypothetical protein